MIGKRGEKALERLFFSLLGFLRFTLALAHDQTYQHSQTMYFLRRLVHEQEALLAGLGKRSDRVRWC